MENSTTLNLDRFDSQTKENIENFYFQVLLTDPIKKIIDDIKNNNLGFNPIKFLNSQLEKFAELALKIMNINLKVKKLAKDNEWNDFNQERYLSYFESLLNFFEKTIKNAK
jgi:hypothetical protein